MDVLTQLDKRLDHLTQKLDLIQEMQSDMALELEKLKVTLKIGAWVAGGTAGLVGPLLINFLLTQLF